MRKPFVTSQAGESGEKKMPMMREKTGKMAEIPAKTLQWQIAPNV
jgi:hypothetical protein